MWPFLLQLLSVPKSLFREEVRDALTLTPCKRKPSTVFCLGNGNLLLPYVIFLLQYLSGYSVPDFCLLPCILLLLLLLLHRFLAFFNLWCYLMTEMHTNPGIWTEI